MTAAVLIAGAGPVGMTLAMSLKRLEVDVRIVDKAPARTDKSKALVIWPRTLELLDIQGCAQPFLDAGHPAVGARMITWRIATVLPSSRSSLVMGCNSARAALTSSVGFAGLESPSSAFCPPPHPASSTVAMAAAQIATRQFDRACFITGCGRRASWSPPPLRAR